MKIQVVLFRGRGLLSALIRWQTWSPFSHVAVKISGDNGEHTYFIESYPGKGVHLYTQLPHGTEGVTFRDVKLSQLGAFDVETFLRSQLGKPYDYIGVLRFLPRWAKKDNSRWFCSDLVARAFEYARAPMTNDSPYYKCSPAMVGDSVRLIK